MLRPETASCCQSAGYGTQAKTPAEEVVTKLSLGDGRGTQSLSLTLSGFGIVRSVAALYQA